MALVVWLFDVFLVLRSSRAPRFCGCEICGLWSLFVGLWWPFVLALEKR